MPPTRELPNGGIVLTIDGRGSVDCVEGRFERHKGRSQNLTSQRHLLISWLTDTEPMVLCRRLGGAHSWDNMLVRGGSLVVEGNATVLLVATSIAPKGEGRPRRKPEPHSLSIFCPSNTLEAERSLLQVSNHDALLCALQLPPRSEPLQYRVLPLVLGAIFHFKMSR